MYISVGKTSLPPTQCTVSIWLALVTVVLYPIIILITGCYFQIFIRHVLAAIHFNSNLMRETKNKADGSEQLRIIYPKFKNGEASVRDVRINQNFGKIYFN